MDISELVAEENFNERTPLMQSNLMRPMTVVVENPPTVCGDKMINNVAVGRRTN